MDTIANERNGATWIRDCLLGGPEIAQAIGRLELNCRDGVRHFSAIGLAVPLSEAKKKESEISRSESEIEEEVLLF